MHAGVNHLLAGSEKAVEIERLDKRIVVEKCWGLSG